MMSDKLQNAREYEESYMKYVDQERPGFHLTGPIGWINDPNGFSVYKGEYHLFFQYHPYQVKWGPMHWGHAKTKDFLKWEFLPCALAPDTEADYDGCFSGGAIETPDGKHVLMYTGVIHKLREDGYEQPYQQQCMAIGDGINYEKYEGNPVLTEKDLPEGASPFDFRDPHIFKIGDMYYSVIGNRSSDDSGYLLVYESEDLLHWKFKTVLDSCYNEYGKMWECPDFFSLDGKHVILVSPQEMAPLGLEFHAGFGTIALIGSFDPDKFSFERENLHAIDYGTDFYAPQTLTTPDGRQIMIAWMENWTNVESKIFQRRLFGAMTLPRELSIRNGRLVQNPVREIRNYYGRKVHFENVIIKNETHLAGVNGRHIDLTVDVKPVSENGFTCFNMKLAEDGEHGVSIRYKPGTGVVKVDRSRSGGRFDIVHIREFYVNPHEGGIRFRAILDGNSLELFVNDGEQAATFKLYNKSEHAKTISFEADAPVSISVKKYDIHVPDNFRYVTE